MPAFVNSSVSSWGIRLDDATGVCPRCAKKSRKAARSSSAVRGGDTGDKSYPPPVTVFLDVLTASRPAGRRRSFPDRGPSLGGAPARLLRRRGSHEPGLLRRALPSGPERHRPPSLASGV